MAPTPNQKRKALQKNIIKICHIDENKISTKKLKENKRKKSLLPKKTKILTHPKI
jgi:hypothetical protein